jgi:FAD:protein FMN transferase
MLYLQRIFQYLIIACGCMLLAEGGSAQSRRFSYEQFKMGAPFQVVIYCQSQDSADNLAQECFALVDSLNLVFSDYLENSEINRLCRSAETAIGQGVQVSPALFDILQRSARAFEVSDGAFDITIGPLSKLWRSARKSGKFPEADTVMKAKALVGFDGVQLDTAHRKVQLRRPGIQLDMGGIAQGYVAQEVLALLEKKGVRQALVNASGDIVTVGAPPGKSGWTIAVNVPGRTGDLLGQNITISGKAVSTSGDAYQYMEYQGKRYAHIVDPRTGYGVTTRRNVTVIAEDGTTADWLATTCCILPRRRALRMAKKMGAECMIGWVKGQKVHFRSTHGFKKYWQQ